MKRPLFLLSFALLFLFGSTFSAQNNRKRKPKAALQEYVGRYEIDPKLVENYIVDVTLQDGELWIKPSYLDKRKLIRQSPDSFVVHDMTIPVTFNRDKKGRVISLTTQIPSVSDGKPISPRKISLPAPSRNGNTTFRLKGYSGAHVVAVAGTFNNWNQSQLLFMKEESGWVCRVNLAPGRYTYKFIVDGDWIVDPANPTVETDQRGFMNSVLVVKSK